MVSSSNSSIRCLKRLEKEKQDINDHKEVLTLECDEKNPQKWYISFEGAKGSLYEGEKFKLQFFFNENYVS